jgi:hypothetical protein
MDATNRSDDPAAETASAAPSTSSSDEGTAIADAASYDEPYRFGRRPNSRAPFPFTEREFARLLIVRGRLQANRPLEA